MYTVYRTTCLVNQKIYIGVHKTNNPMDDYLGSGKLVRNAIAKYGIEQFVKEILLECETADEAFQLETHLVTQELIDSGTCYNLKLGGQGGFDWINSDELRQEWTSKGGMSCQNIHPHLKKNLTPFAVGHKVSQRSIDALRQSAKTAFSGKSHSDESKAKMSAAKKGSNNSQFGTIWINDGSIAKKHRGDVPEGWFRGKKVSHAD